MAIDTSSCKRSFRWASLILAATLLVPATAQAVNCAKQPNHPDCTGNEKVPSVIEFVDPLGRVRSDIGLPYVDGQDGVEAFIGSQANTGNIWLRTWSPSEPRVGTRSIRLDFGDPDLNPDDPPECLPPDNNDYRLQFLKVDLNDEIPGGVYSLQPGVPQDSEMRLRFFDNNDQPWFLNFGGGEPKVCGKRTSSRVLITRTAGEEGSVVGEWSVEPQGGALACLEKVGTAKGEKQQYCGTFHMPFKFTITPQ